VNILKDIKLENNELVLQFSKKFNKSSIKKMILNHPHRQVFDFKNVHLKNKRISKKFPKYIRIAQFKTNIVRIVIQNRSSYTCIPYTSMLPENELHISLGKKYSSVMPRKFIKPKKVKRSSKSINEIFSELEMVNRDDERKYTIDNNKENEFSIVSTRANKDDLIVIDAGHGGHDSGAVGGGKKEKDLVLSISKKVAKALKKHGYSVYLTRSKDQFLKLSQRTKIADKKEAVAFISIHANSVPKSKRHRIHGIETFFLQNTRDAKSQRIAARENASVLKGAGSKLSKNVIIDSVLNGPKIIESNKLAIDVQRRIISSVRSKYTGVKDGGVRHAPFYVLVGASRPSILVEVGYISHPRERKRLFTKGYQNLIANGIAKGVDSYLNNRKREIDID
jgi:N-acetylmuramoyl-L-alanine amidase